MDYLTISRNIQETMEKAGCPLSEDQYAVLVGSLAVYIELQGTQDKSKVDNQDDKVVNKSPSPCRHTLEDGADTTTELVSGKSSGLIGGMRQETTEKSDEKIDINQKAYCENCVFFSQDCFSQEFGYCHSLGKDVKNHENCNMFSASRHKAISG